MALLKEDDMPDFVKKWVKNWVTSVLGASAGGTMILNGFAANPDDYSLIVQGCLVLLLGLFSKDNDVTGGTVKQ